MKPRPLADVVDDNHFLHDVLWNVAKDQLNGLLLIEGRNDHSHTGTPASLLTAWFQRRACPGNSETSYDHKLGLPIFLTRPQ